MSRAGGPAPWCWAPGAGVASTASWRLCGAAWGLEVPAPGGPGEEGSGGAGSVTTPGGKRPRSAAKPPPMPNPLPCAVRSCYVVVGSAPRHPLSPPETPGVGGSCTLRTKSDFFTRPGPHVATAPSLALSGLPACLRVSAAPGCAQARPLTRVARRALGCVPLCHRHKPQSTRSSGFAGLSGHDPVHGAPTTAL